jgi:uncharacterized oxidoreductase
VDSKGKKTIMKMTENTVLITGGTSGIGLELARQLLDLGNTVVVTGRNQARLDHVREELPRVHTVQCDVSDPQAIPLLFEAVVGNFPALNMLINNAGIMRKINLHTTGTDRHNITEEIEINLSGSIRMVMQFLPHLKAQRSAAIVNVSSGLAFVPFAIAPIYGATKAGLHSFTQSLRFQLKRTNIQVFELAPPATDTPLNEKFAKELKGTPLMPVEKVARLAIKGFERDRLEIRPGFANVLKLMSRIAPDFIAAQLARLVDPMLAEAEVEGLPPATV